MSSLFWKILPVYKILEWAFLGLIFDVNFFEFTLLGILVVFVLLFSSHIQEHEK